MSAFSKGMRQKVLLSAALLHDPEVVILDEPSSGLDVAFTLILRRLVMTLAARGKTIIYSSHEMDMVEKICNDVVILHKGNVVAHDSVITAARAGARRLARGRVRGAGRRSGRRSHRQRAGHRGGAMTSSAGPLSGGSSSGAPNIFTSGISSGCSPATRFVVFSTACLCRAMRTRCSSRCGSRRWR